MNHTTQKIEGGVSSENLTSFYDIDIHEKTVKITIDYSDARNHTQLNEDVQSMTEALGKAIGEHLNMHAILPESEPDNPF